MLAGWEKRSEYDRGLLREARAQAGLSHLNILPVTDFLEVDGTAAIVMEYVEGGRPSRPIS